MPSPKWDSKQPPQSSAGMYGRESMIEKILDECTKRGTCPLNRKEFDEAFAGHDLAVQLRSACDFARQHDLAFGRSTGDQNFMFSRLPKTPESRHPTRRFQAHGPNSHPQAQRQNGFQRKQKSTAKAWSLRSF
jgi:hypothetical protein